MNADFPSFLQISATDDEHQWLATENLLNSLPPELAQMAWAAAVPHWFDAEVLAALHPELKDRAAELYARLQALPFVEPFAGGGHNIDEVTRRLLLARLWRARPEDYVAFSRLAAGYFGQRTIDNQLPPEAQIEHIYHLLVADPEKGADSVWKQGAEWGNEPDAAYSRGLLRIRVKIGNSQVSSLQATLPVMSLWRHGAVLGIQQKGRDHQSGGPRPFHLYATGCFERR